MCPSSSPDQLAKFQSPGKASVTGGRGEERRHPQTSGPPCPLHGIWPNLREDGSGSNYKPSPELLQEQRAKGQLASFSKCWKFPLSSLICLSPAGRFLWGRPLRDFAGKSYMWLGLSGPLWSLQMLLQPGGLWQPSKWRAIVGVWLWRDGDKCIQVHIPVTPAERGHLGQVASPLWACSCICEIGCIIVRSS